MAAVSLAWYGCDGGTTTPTGTLFPERDFVCAAGATAPCETTEPASSDAARTREEPSDFAAGRLTYLVNLISIPPVQEGEAPGFNLDGLDSGLTGDPAPGANCERFQADFTSPADPDQVGVDNALATLVPTIEDLALDGESLDALLLEQINSGSVLLMMEITGVDSLSYDSNVSVRLFLGAVPGGGMPMLGADGRLAPGQTFSVETDLGVAVTGSIFDGRLQAATPMLPLTINAGDLNLELVISDAQIRVNVAESGATMGVIGGSITVDAIVAAAAGAGINEMTVRPVIEGFTDIGPTAANPMTCTALSVGIAFAATTATIAP